MTVARIDSEKTEICRLVLIALPQWFGIPEAIERYAAEAADLVMLGKLVGDQVIGFLTLKPVGPGVTEIHVIGVRPEHRGMGIGRELIEAAAQHEQARGVELLTVKTLGNSVEDVHYAETRAFYHSVGFLEIEEFPNYWNGTHPMLLLAKPI